MYPNCYSSDFTKFEKQKKINKRKAFMKTWVNPVKINAEKTNSKVMPIIRPLKLC